MPIASDKVASLPSSAVVVIPCLNEEGYIQGVIDHFAAESRAHGSKDRRCGWWKHGSNNNNS